MAQSDEVADLVQRRSFNILSGVGHRSEIGEPVELNAVKHNIALRMRSIAEERNERYTERATDIAVAAIHHRRRLRPIDGVRVVACVHVDSRGYQSGLFKL